MGKKDLVGLSISVEWDLLKEFDRIIQEEGYENRSFVVRMLFREFILSKKPHKESKPRNGIFVIFVIFNGRTKISCDDNAFFVISLKNSPKRLCLCVVEGSENIAKEKFKEFSSDPNVEHCKIMTMGICND